MKKLAIWTGVVAFAVTFGFGGAVKIAQASHSETFCAAHPLHPHCPPTGGGAPVGDFYFLAPFVALGTCDNDTCIGAKVGEACSVNADCKGEVDGSARLNSLGLWSVDTIGLTPPDFSPPDVFEENHDICLVADLLSGGTLTLSLNDNTNTTAVGNFRHEGRIDPEDTNDLPNTIFKLAIQIYHDPTELAGLCAGTVVQVTGLTITPF